MTFTLPEQFVELPPLEHTDQDVRASIAAIQQDLQAIATELAHPANALDASFQANGAAFAAAAANTGLVNLSFACDGRSRVRIRGTVRIGGNTAGALMQAMIFIDGVDSGVRGSVIAQGGGVYVTAAIDGWVQPTAGAHTLALYGAVGAGIGNCDAAFPSFLSISGN